MAYDAAQAAFVHLQYRARRGSAREGAGVNQDRPNEVEALIIQGGYRHQI
jgi:hypothetical protein